MNHAPSVPGPSPVLLAECFAGLALPAPLREAPCR